jgi:hypothetical protein
MRITIGHYYDFGSARPVVGDDLVRPETWDALRTKTAGPFAIAATREQLEAEADARLEIAARARAIDSWLAEVDARTVASYGVGAAVLELWLHRLRPRRRLVLTDYAPETVTRLGGLLPEVEVRIHDLLVDPPLDADAHLFHRIDTELTDDDWGDVLRRFGSERVLVVATEVATLPRLARELLLRARRKGLTRAGWLRTRDAFEALWAETHEARPLAVNDLQGWELTPRPAA